VVIPDVTATVHRDLIIAFAAQHRLPAVYYSRMFVAASGLMSYGNDLVDVFRQAAPYVDRILRGDKPADLPVHAATEFETSSTSKPRRRSASQCRPACLSRPTR
jgi:putative ABC transport system substrate-binding protein